MYPLLSGLTVIAASSFAASLSAGPYLAQIGAEVIRVDQVGDVPDFGRWPQAANGAVGYPAAETFAAVPQLKHGAPRPAPGLGADSDELLERGLGHSSGQVAAFHDKRLIAQA